MRSANTILHVMAFVLACFGVSVSAARAESKHIFGIHFFGHGANVDVMSHRSGWVVEANTTHNESGPDITGRYRPATGEGFTILQRLDWKWTQTIPLTGPEQDDFARQCADNWAANIKNYCRHYSIGNEVEFANVTPEIYASCFRKVRNAILARQPDARVIIGHMISSDNQRSAMQLLGRDGYDGVTAHAQTSVPTGLLNILDEPNLHPEGPARPGVGVYITEWGWKPPSDKDVQAVMTGFYNALGTSNASRARQVYCACWFVYPQGIGWDTFALQIWPVENAGFEATTALGTAWNAYADNPITVTDLLADIYDGGTSVVARRTTNVPSRTQIWWMSAGSAVGSSSSLDQTPMTVHQRTISGLTPSAAYEIMPLSTANDYADFGGRRFRVKTGPWPSTVTQTGPNRVEVQWTTDWGTDSRVEYGPTTNLGSVAHLTASVFNHSVQLDDVAPYTNYYRILSSEPNPDAGEPRLYMRSPIRSFYVQVEYPADMDTDNDVDMTDFGLFQACYTGPGVDQTDPDCQRARLDLDSDVDQADYSLFRNCLTGPGGQVDPDCAG